MLQGTCDRRVRFDRLVSCLSVISAHVRHASDVLLTFAVVGDVAAFMVRRASECPHCGEVPLVSYPRLVGPANFTPQRVD